MQTKKISLNDVYIEYLLSGKEKSETIIFVHWLGANLTQFENQYEYFSLKYNVLLINLRGHGNSNLKSKFTDFDFKLPVIASDVIELLQTLKITKAHYVGNSMGGNIGYEILKIKPNVLLSFTTFGTTAELHIWKMQFTIVRLMYRLISSKLIATLSTQAGYSSESKRKIKEMLWLISKTTILYSITNLWNLNYLDVIKKSELPVFIIKGERDKDINKVIWSTILEFTKRGNFQFFEMQNVGHFVNLDNPDLFNIKLDKFLLNHTKQKKQL